MASKALADRQRALEEALDGDLRYIDVALALTRDKDGSTLLYAGGEWDRRERRFTGRDPSRVAVVALEESQVEFTSWFAGFVRDYREGYPRDVSLALVAGDRRGGKTFDTYLCQVAALIDIPCSADGTPTIGWTVSRTYRERDELDQVMSSYVPDTLYRQQRAPEHRYIFKHGSYLRNLSADDPKALKQGRVDFLLYNEPQKMSPKAIKNGLYGTADRGGLTVLAANPPDGPDGDWLRDLKEAIDEDPVIKPITRFFNFSSKQNTKIDAPARVRVAKVASKIDPDMSDADADGTWRRWGDLAYPSWNGRLTAKDPLGLVGLCPDVGIEDLTAALTRKEFGRAFDHIVGGDFQRKPQAAAVMKIIKVPDIVEPVYWFTDEVGTKGTEIELSTDLMGFPHSYGVKSGESKSAMIVGDCSGSWQGSERIRGRTSFTLLESEGWFVVPAEIVRGTNSERPRNPDVAQRLGLMQRLMEARRIRVSPSCVWIIEAFLKCQLRRTETGTRVPKGRYAHVTDAASYAIWRMEPRPKTNALMPSKGNYRMSHHKPQGPRIL